MAKTLNQDRQTTILSSVTDSESAVFAWNDCDRVGFAVTAGSATNISLQTAINEDGTFAEVDSFTSQLGVVPSGGVFKLVVTGGPVTVVASGYRDRG